MTTPPRPANTRLLWPGRDMTWRVFFTRLIKELDHDAVDDVAATITFYAVLALFPFLLFVIAVVSKVVSWDTIDELVREVSRVMPREVTSIVSERLVLLKKEPASGILTFGFVGALWSASAGIGALIPALDRAYDVVETRPFWKRRLLSIVITLGVGALALLASLIAIAIPAVAAWIGGPLGVLLDWMRLPIAGHLTMFTWAGLYTVLPNVRPRFQPVTPGSVVGVILWVAASWGFSVYVRNFGSYEATYGALGGVVVLLLWMWVSSMALILGAEINKILMPPEDTAEIDTHVEHHPEVAKAQEAHPEPATAAPEKEAPEDVPNHGEEDPRVPTRESTT